MRDQPLQPSSAEMQPISQEPSLGSSTAGGVIVASKKIILKHLSQYFNNRICEIDRKENRDNDALRENHRHSCGMLSHLFLKMNHMVTLKNYIFAIGERPDKKKSATEWRANSLS
jgi:hypothetical protein